MTESVNNGTDLNGLILVIGVLVLALLVLLRNRPFIFLGSLFRSIGRPLRKLVRPITAVLRALRIIPRTVTKEGRNYVGPSAFSSVIRAFRQKTEVEQELDKTEFMAEIARKAIEKAREHGTPELEAAAKIFHDNYDSLSKLLTRAYKDAEGDLDATRENFKNFQETPPEGYKKPELYVDPNPELIKPALEHESQHLRTRGFIFKWLEPDGHYIREEDIEWEQAEKNYFLANIFFTYDIPVGTPRSGIKPTDLYEEIDGAFGVSMFGIKDRDAYYLLAQMRKVINGNVRRLTVWFSLIATAFLLFNLYITGGPSDTLLRNVLDLTPATVGGVEVAGETKILMASFLISILAMWLLYTAEYRHYVRNNGREMNNFLTRYLARLNNFYRQAERNARGVFAGEVDVKHADMQKQAQVWFANIQWVAFRAFYIETFLRNTLYQIYRNSGYYIFLIPLLFILGIYLLLSYTGYLSKLGGMFVWGSLADPEVLHAVTFSGALAVLIAIVAYYLTHSLRDLEGTIREAEWFNFHHFALQRTTTNLIGRYGGEIKFWRERLKSSEGRTG